MIGSLRTEVPLGSRYLLHDVIGRGSMGSVYRASLRNDYGPPGLAVKVLHPELASDPDVVAGLMQESAILTGLRDRHLVKVQDVVFANEMLAIVMELVHGTGLRPHLGVRGTLPPAEAVELVAQFLQGLSAVHAAGIVHGDVKPENILLDLTGPHPMAKLADVGLAKVAHAAQTNTTSAIGTPDYMAPELADGAPPSPSSDIYAAGVVLYELLAGRTPFASSHPVAVLRRQVDSAPPAIPGLHVGLVDVLDRMLAKDPDFRPVSAAAAVSQLRELAPKLSGLPAHKALPKGSLVTPTQSPPTRVRLDSAPDPVGSDEGATAPQLPPPTTVPDAPRQLPNFPRKSVIAGLIALSVAACAGLAWTLRPASETAAQQAATLYAFAPLMRGDGLTVTRTWTLSGPDFTHLTEELTVGNSNTTELRAHYDLVIPKEIAAKASLVDFTPVPSKIIAEDPVVRFNLRLKPAESRTIRYQTTVSGQGQPGHRLSVWAVAYAEAASHYADSLEGSAPAVTIRKLVVKPTQLSTRVGQKARLALSGKLSDGSAAPRVLLRQATWRTSDGQVVAVDSKGRVLAVSGGAATISAKLGNVSAKMVVKVKPLIVRAPASIRSVSPSFSLRPTLTSAPAKKPAGTPSKASKAPKKASKAPKKAPKAPKAPKATQTKKATQSQRPGATPASTAPKTDPTSVAPAPEPTSETPKPAPTTAAPTPEPTSETPKSSPASGTAKAVPTSATATPTRTPRPTRTAVPRRTTRTPQPSGAVSTTAVPSTTEASTTSSSSAPSQSSATN